VSENERAVCKFHRTLFAHGAVIKLPNSNNSLALADADQTTQRKSKIARTLSFKSK
jgi:hypothetical protein